MLAIGVLVLLVTWLPLLFRRLALSLAIACVAIGYLIASQGDVNQQLGLLHSVNVLELLTEGVLLVALIGAGLKIDRPVGLRRWSSTWRLIGIAMPLTIGAMTLLLAYVGGYAWAPALLLAAALAPTDPVLASQVAVGPPGTGEEGEVRFALTSEAGLNDGMAYPFVLLALALAAGERVDAAWLGLHFVVLIALSVALGWGFGRVFGWLVFRPRYARLSNTGDGLVALAASFIAYAITELMSAYGFAAVFIAALTLRASCRDSEFHQQMSDFSDQIERVLLMVVLLVFGASLANGLLATLTRQDAVLGLLLIFVVRPAIAAISLIGSPHPWISRGATAFFGIRGIGAFYYGIYAFSEHTFAAKDRMWAFIGFVVLVSIVVHGMLATPVMSWLDRQRERMQRQGHAIR